MAGRCLSDQPSGNLNTNVYEESGLNDEVIFYLPLRHGLNAGAVFLWIVIIHSLSNGGIHVKYVTMSRWVYFLILSSSAALLRADLRIDFTTTGGAVQTGYQGLYLETSLGYAQIGGDTAILESPVIQSLERMLTFNLIVRNLPATGFRRNAVWI